MAYKPKVVLITTDTLHHRYLIKTINSNSNIELIIFFIKEEKIFFKDKFSKAEFKFENKFFFKNKKYNIKTNYLYFKNVNSDKLKMKIKSLKPKLGILFGTKKVDMNLINIFEKKLINIHRGIMEKYRGLDSEFWACYFEDYKNIGSTVHFVNAELDKGRIIFQKRLRINNGMKAYQLKALTTKIVSEKINNIIKNNLSKKITTKKNQKIGNYFSKIDIPSKKKAIVNFNSFCKNSIK